MELQEGAHDFPKLKAQNAFMSTYAGDGDNCECKVEAVTSTALHVRLVKIHNNWSFIGVMNIIGVVRTIPLKHFDWSLRDPELAYHLQK